MVWKIEFQLSRLGDILVNRFSDFDPRKYGHRTLSSLVTSMSGIVSSQEKTTTYISLKSTMQKEQIMHEIVDIIHKK